MKQENCILTRYTGIIVMYLLSYRDLILDISLFKSRQALK